MNPSNLIGFEVHLIPNDLCSEPQILNVPIGAALEICAHCMGAVLKLVPVYGLSPVSDPESKE